MYSTSSSSSQHSTPPSTTTTNTNNLTRYDSAPTSFLSTVAETVSGLGLGLPHHNHNHQQFYSGSRDSIAPESTHLQHQHQHQHHHSESRNTLTLLHENSYDNSPVKAAGTTTAASNNLIRHSSSPANFLHQLTSDLGYCNSNQGGSVNGHNLSRLGTQLSFTKQDHHSLSQISELNGCGGMLEGMSSHDNNNNNNSHTTLKRASTSSSQPRSSSGFSLSAWEDSNDGFSFSGPSSTKRNKSINDDILNGLVSMESQDIAFEMTSMDRLMQIPQDSVPCKIRAKRGFATHPRSIAERERRTRISGKLKKLQDLVPNMDKQTSYADMLDLAVQHIKGLQNEVQKLNGELDRCTCGCKENVQH